MEEGVRRGRLRGGPLELETCLCRSQMLLHMVWVGMRGDIDVRSRIGLGNHQPETTPPGQFIGPLPVKRRVAKQMELHSFQTSVLKSMAAVRFLLTV